MNQPTPPLRRWRARHFKSLVEVEIEFAPLTVLLGRNSAGKSSVLQALLLLTQAQRSSFEDDTIALNGEFIKLGDFEEVRSFRAPVDAPVELDVELDLPMRTQERRTTVNWHVELHEPLPPGKGTAAIGAVVADVEEPQFGRARLVARRSGQSRSHGAHLSSARDANAAAFAGEFEYREPEDENEDEVDKYDVAGVVLRGGFPIRIVREVNDVRLFLSRLLRREQRGPEPLAAPVTGKPLDDDELERIVQAVVDAVTAERRGESAKLEPDLLKMFDQGRARQRAADLERGVMARVEAGEPVHVGANDPGAEALREASALMRSLFQRCVWYLGPLRMTPGFTGRGALTGAATDVGVRGEHTATALLAYGGKRVESPPRMPGEEVGSPTLAEAVDAWIRWLGVGESVTTHDLGRQGIELRVHDAAAGNDVDLPNVGVGVSQLLPVVVVCLLAGPGSVVLLEQPELHLHPASQQRLGDFLLACVRTGRQIIIETHSETLVTRLRRRVAEGADGSTLGLLSLLFATRDEEGATQLRPVELNQYGGLDEWPEGFFDAGTDDVAAILRTGADKLRDG